MKKIIKGKTYNTDTATLVAAWSDGIPEQDMDYISETLYRTPGGDYFIYGIGGLFTKYATEEHDFPFRGGQKIIPISEAEAEQWAAEVLDGEEFKKAFGITEEEKIKCVKIDKYIYSAQYLRMEQLAEQTGMNLTDWLDQVLDRVEEISRDPLSVMLTYSGRLNQFAFKRLLKDLRERREFSSLELTDMLDWAMCAIVNSPYDLEEAFVKQFGNRVSYRMFENRTDLVDFSDELERRGVLYRTVKELYEFIDEVSA